MKVIVGIVVVAVLAALATNWLRGKELTLVHNSFDTSLPHKVDEHVWTAVHHGHPVRRSRLRFSHQHVTTVRCGEALGAFAVGADHHFSFSPQPGRLRTGCPGSALRRSLTHATHVDVSEHDGTLEMTLSDIRGHAVAVFRSTDG